MARRRASSRRVAVSRSENETSSPFKGSFTMSAKPSFRSVLEHHPEHVKAIGMISIEMGSLDVTLGDLLGALLHIAPELGRIVYLTPRSGFGRLELLKNVAEKSLSSPQVSKVFSRAKALMQKRHEIMHDTWGVDAETRKPSRQKTKGQHVLVELSDLQNMVRDIRDLITDAHELAARLYADWPAYASLDKSGLPRRRGQKQKTHPRKATK